MHSLRKNAILSAYIDHLCLLCQEYMRSKSDVIAHIKKPVHQKRLDSAYVVGKCEDDKIIKVHNGYYCVFCNELITMTSKLHLHVSEKSHMLNKGNQSLKRVGHYVVVFDSLLIEERAWSGLLGDSCVVCNVDYTDENLHRSDQRHAVNLIQNKVEFGSNLRIYRTVDNTTFYCVTCNDLFSMYSFSNHFENDDHKNSVRMCSIAYEMFHSRNISKLCDARVSDSRKEYLGNCEFKHRLDDAGSSQSRQSDSLSDEYYSTESNDLFIENTHNILASIDNFEKNSMKIILENETAYCSKCANYVEFDVEVISNHIKLHDNIDAETTHEFKNESAQCKTDMSEKTRNTFQKDKSIEELEHSKSNIIVVDKNENIIDVKSRNDTEKGEIISEIKNKEVVFEKQHPSTDLHKEKFFVSAHNNKALSTDKSLLESIAYFEKNGLDIDFISDFAFCRKCYKSVTFNYDALFGHIEAHNTYLCKRSVSRVPFQCEVNKKVNMPAKPVELEKNKNLLPEKEKLKPAYKAIKPRLDNTAHETNIKNLSIEEDSSCDDPREFAKQNHLTYNDGNQNAYCRVCEKKLPSSLRSMKEHVTGLPHRKKAAWNAANLSAPNHASKSLSSRSYTRFLNEEFRISNGIFTEKVLNGKFCISENSLNCITEVNNRLRCHLCEINLMRHNVVEHVNDGLHENAMSNARVLLSWDTEFVREVRLDLYHCGFCNLMSLGLDDLKQHFNSIQHRLNKSKANDRLSRHGPRIEEARRRHMAQNAFNFLNFRRFMHMHF